MYIVYIYDIFIYIINKYIRVYIVYYIDDASKVFKSNS